MTISIRTEGRRTYIDGDTYPHRNALRDAGAHWDGDAKAWWLGDRTKAEELAGRLGGNGSNDGERLQQSDKLNDDSRIAGKAKYKGKTYILVWIGETKRGRAAKLAFADGSKVFWADAAEVEITKTYKPHKSGYGRYAREEHMTFGRLRRLQEEWRTKTPEQRDEDRRAGELGGRCRCAKPLDEGDGECMQCGYLICQ